MEQVKTLKHDTMTTGERMKAVVNNTGPDRIPFIPMAVGFCAKTANYSIRDIYENPEKSFWAQVWTQELFGYDGSPTHIYGSLPAWEFGGKIRWPEEEWEQAPIVEQYPVASEEDVWRIELPDVKKSGFTPITIEFCKLCERHNMPIVAGYGTPFTWAANLCGVSQFCNWMIKKPDLAHRLLQLATEYILAFLQYFINTFGKGRVNCYSYMPTESNYVISPKQFKEFAFPYQKEAYEKAQQMGVTRFVCHVCGDHNLNLPYLAQMPFPKKTILSFGHEVKLTNAMKYFGDKYIIAGNVEPALIQKGTPQQVYDNARKCIEYAKYSPSGFILMSGCELPPHAPPYNVYMMKKAVDDFGSYE